MGIKRVVYAVADPNPTNRGKAKRTLKKHGLACELCEGGLKLATSLADEWLSDEWLTVMAPVFIGSKRISHAIRGTAIHNGSFLADGDSFYTAGLSDCADWPGEETKVKFDKNGNPA